MTGPKKKENLTDASDPSTTIPRDLTTHEIGKRILFPDTEVVDRLILRCSQLLTNSKQLGLLVKKVLEKRGESLDFKEVCQDLVHTHERVPGDSSFQH